MKLINLFNNQKLLRHLHRQLAPIMLLPILITLFTGIFFELAINMDKGDNFLWLLSWHRGNFGLINLEKFYPFLNGFGLLILTISGINLWWQNIYKNKTFRNNDNK
ncbi:hypothetical protein GM3708_2781 [Geminocystis sp. NIES-3708]|uniref:hypothetical protein n=1 Tax=Geminocystis sp. NIES-3708 TaxID=1615909 RepID=UPI0005FC9539|nr:hypothetical protein [Geminocystis sp. NIES-3708]BAQ62375.1 hypothetical protein GM3708_2781 [Geminocystis sp. NIES-3708]